MLSLLIYLILPNLFKSLNLLLVPLVLAFLVPPPSRSQVTLSRAARSSLIRGSFWIPPEGTKLEAARVVGEGYDED